MTDVPPFRVKMSLIPPAPSPSVRFPRKHREVHTMRYQMLCICYDDQRPERARPSDRVMVSADRLVTPRVDS
jgi:hypothetical protein